MKRIAIIFIVMFFTGCSSSNLDDVKANACKTWESVGYDCIGYEGYQWGLWLGGDYGGAAVWHTLTRKQAPNIIYSGYVKKWGDEYHVYGPSAIDAIKPQR